MTNAAPAVDDNGDIYVATGNVPNHPQLAMGQLGESVVKLSWNPGDPGSLTVAPTGSHRSWIENAMAPTGTRTWPPPV